MHGTPLYSWYAVLYLLCGDATSGEDFNVPESFVNHAFGIDGSRIPGLGNGGIGSRGLAGVDSWMNGELPDAWGDNTTDREETDEPKILKDNEPNSSTIKYVTEDTVVATEEPPAPVKLKYSYDEGNLNVAVDTKRDEANITAGNPETTRNRMIISRMGPPPAVPSDRDIGNTKTNMNRDDMIYSPHNTAPSVIQMSDKIKIVQPQYMSEGIRVIDRSGSPAFEQTQNGGNMRYPNGMPGMNGMNYNNGYSGYSGGNYGVPWNQGMGQIDVPVGRSGFVPYGQQFGSMGHPGMNNMQRDQMGYSGYSNGQMVNMGAPVGRSMMAPYGAPSSLNSLPMNPQDMGYYANRGQMQPFAADPRLPYSGVANAQMNFDAMSHLGLGGNIYRTAETTTELISYADHLTQQGIEPLQKSIQTDGFSNFGLIPPVNYNEPPPQVLNVTQPPLLTMPYSQRGAMSYNKSDKLLLRGVEIEPMVGLTNSKEEHRGVMPKAVKVVPDPPIYIRAPLGPGSGQREPRVTPEPVARTTRSEGSGPTVLHQWAVAGNATARATKPPPPPPPPPTKSAVIAKSSAHNATGETGTNESAVTQKSDEAAIKNIFRDAPKSDDFGMPVQWVPSYAKETESGLARVTDPKTMRNYEIRVNNHLFVPIAYHGTTPRSVFDDAPSDLDSDY